MALVPVAVIFLVFSYFATDLYANYFKYPALFLVILVTVVALLITRLFLIKQQYFRAWAASAVTIAGATFFGVIGLFPNLFPSSIDKAFSLSAFNASSSPLTLKIMLGVVAVFIPIVIIYQVWSYYMFTSQPVDPGRS